MGHPAHFARREDPRAQVCSRSRISVYEGVMPVGSRLTAKVRGPAGVFGFRVPAALCQ
jgi:hypothetical protein